MQALMERVTSADGTKVSYETSGTGEPLVLVHGGFSDHISNWELVKPALNRRFMVYAIARRGRGTTDATKGHRLEDEAMDVAAVIQQIDRPVFLLGHSYGAQCALAAALLVAERVRKLVLYEPPRTDTVAREAVARLEVFAAAEAWDEFARTFFGDCLQVPAAELDAVRASALWPPIVADARATLGDLRALVRYDFDAARFRDLAMPVLLQIGTESPRELYVTDALAAVLPHARIEPLPGQAHEGMTTAPEIYARAVIEFLLGDRVSNPSMHFS